MATGGDVLTFLKPNGGWVIAGDDFDSIRWDDGASKITKAEFEAGFAQFDAWQIQEQANAIEAKNKAQAKLVALGLTADDLKALGL
jgi:hypothetical protein